MAEREARTWWRALEEQDRGGTFYAATYNVTATGTIVKASLAASRSGQAA